MAILISLSIIPIIIKFMLGDIDENKRNKKIFYIICGICIFLVMGLRDRYTGSHDTDVYSLMLENFNSNLSLNDYLKSKNPDEIFFLFAEYGFYSLIWFLGKMQLDPQYLLIVSAFVISSCTLVFLYRHSNDSLLSIIMFICLGSFTFAMNGMRQAMAMSICLLSYLFVEKRKLIPFLITVFVATLFHKTAIIFTLVYLLNFMQFKFSHFVMLFLAFVLFYIFSENLIEIFDDVTNKDYSDGESFDGGGLITVLLYVASLLLLIMCDEEFRIQILPIIFITIIGLYLYLFRYFSIQIFERVSYYFYYFVLLIIPMEIKALNKTEKQIVYMLFTLFCIALFAYRISNGVFAEFKFFW